MKYIHFNILLTNFEERKMGNHTRETESSVEAEASSGIGNQLAALPDAVEQTNMELSLLPEIASYAS